MNLPSILFDTSGFYPRWSGCGEWSAQLGWLHILSDLGIWSAYFAIPCVLLYFGVRRRDLPFRKLFFLFGAFILLCGTTHLMEAIIFWWPGYRLAGAIKLATALVSWATVLVLIPIIPKALSLRSPEELEREIARRKRAEEELQKINADLERRVQERTLELVEANDRLHQAEERTRSVVEHVVDGIVTIDEQDRIETFNRAAEKLFGFKAADVLGRNVDVLVPASMPEMEGYLARHLRVDQSGIFGSGGEILGARKDGSRFPMEMSVCEYSLKGRRYFTGIVRDISERKRNEDELRDIAAKLSEADRRKTEFLATLAHELRNPLAPIRTGLELLRMAKDDPVTVEKTRTVMERQTRQLITLVDDLLDVSRITRGKLELRRCRVQLADVVTSAVEASSPFIRDAGHELAVSVPPQPIVLNADPNRLAQVLSNLLNNAAKYTPERNGRIRLTVAREEGEVVIAVEDNGLGIPADQQTKIFEMFAQIDRPMEKGYTGLGIGLTLVKSLVEMHGGRIEVQSDGPNKGSRFTVRLPAPVEPLKQDNAPPADTTRAPGKLRVLVVDDNEAAVDTLGMVVKMLGNEVRTASDGQAGVETAADFRPDVVLMDIGMPRMNGYEAARAIRQQPWGQKMVLVALTGWGQDEDKRRTKEAGFDQHMIKPAEPSDLQRLFASVASRS